MTKIIQYFKNLHNFNLNTNNFSNHFVTVNVVNILFNRVIKEVMFISLKTNRYKYIHPNVEQVFRHFSGYLTRLSSDKVLYQKLDFLSNL